MDMICYHTTDAADAILREGFRGATGTYMCVDYEFTGVWISDRILDVNEGCKGDQVLQVQFPDDVDLAGHELINEDPDLRCYREWCVPAALINTHATVTLMTDDEVDAELTRRFMDAHPGFQPKSLPGWRGDGHRWEATHN